MFRDGGRLCYYAAFHTHTHTPDDIGGGAAAFLFSLGDGVPGKHQPPVEAPDLRLARVPQILKSVPVDHVDDGADHGRGLLFDPGGKRF